MFAPRIVEEFKGGGWKNDHERGSRVYSIRIKVNGEEEKFTMKVLFSGTVLSTAADCLGRDLNDEDREAMARVKIKKEVRNGCLDGLPPAYALTLDINYLEVDDLVFEAIREGKIIS